MGGPWQTPSGDTNVTKNTIPQLSNISPRKQICLCRCQTYGPAQVTGSNDDMQIYPIRLRRSTVMSYWSVMIPKLQLSTHVNVHRFCLRVSLQSSLSQLSPNAAKLDTYQMLETAGFVDRDIQVC